MAGRHNRGPRDKAKPSWKAESDRPCSGLPRPALGRKDSSGGPEVRCGEVPGTGPHMRAFSEEPSWGQVWQVRPAGPTLSS